MKAEFIGTFHGGIWPDEEDYSSEDLSKTKIDQDNTSNDLSSKARELPPLPKKIRELVELRRKGFE